MMTEVVKNEAKLTLRYPTEVKEAYKKIAKEEGMSENSALVQALVWALKFREKFNDIKQ
ncbi:Arc family DNA-binding protein [Enterobacter cloacae]|uniref:Arc family DNA-binding protein n=1 Tax=Enterobacter cloacae TaxID=550 RepID=UPI00325BF10E